MLSKKRNWIVVGLLVMLTGCSTSLGDFFTKPPTAAEQQVALGLAMTGAKYGCQRLAGSINQGERANVARSLDYVADLLSDNPKITSAELATDLAKADPDVAMFAPEIMVVAGLAAAKIPEEQRQALFFLAITAVVQQCRSALADTGTA